MNQTNYSIVEKMIIIHLSTKAVADWLTDDSLVFFLCFKCKEKKIPLSRTSFICTPTTYRAMLYESLTLLTYIQSLALLSYIVITFLFLVG